MTNDHDCHADADCLNKIGSYNCTCRSGYSGNGTICTDDDECLDNTDSCHDDAVCTNTKGAYNCTCNNGYEGDGYNCTGKNPRCINIPNYGLK